MSVDIGTAEGHIILDTSGFVVPLQTAQRDVRNFASDIALQIGGAMQTLGNTIANIGNTITKYISAPLQDFAKSAFSEMSDFEDAMNRAGVIAGANANEMAALTEKAKEMGRTTKFTATEAAEAYKYMGMAGWKSGQMIDGLEGIMNLAAASGEDLATVSDIVTDALTAMGLQASDSAHFADVLTAATLNSNTTVGMLGEAFKYAAPVAGALNYKIEDLTLALGLMANAGIKGAQAGTSLRTAIQRMTTAPGQVAVEMEKLGLSVFNADRSAKPLSQLLGELREKFRGLDDQTKLTAENIILGARAMTGIGAIIEATEDDYNRLQFVLQNAEGTAQRIAQKMLESFAGRVTLLQSAISGFKLQFTQDVLPLFSAFVNRITDVVISVSKLDDGTRKLVLAFVAFGAVIGPLVASFGGVITLLGGAVVGVGFLVSSVSTLSAAIGISAAAFTGFGAAIVASIAAIGGVIATFAAAFTDLMLNNEEFHKNFMAVINGIKQAFFDLKADFDKILDDVGLKNADFMELLLGAWTYVKNAIAPILLWIVENIKNSITLVTSLISGFMQIFGGLVQIFEGNVKEGLSSIFAGIAEMVQGFFASLGQAVISNIKAIKDAIFSFSKSTKEVEEINSRTEDIFTENAKKREEYVKNAVKSEKELTQETEKQVAERLVLYEDALKKNSFNFAESDRLDLEAQKAFNEKYLKNAQDMTKQLPGVIAEQRVPMTTEASKIGFDLTEISDETGAGFVGVLDAHLSQLPGVFNDYLSDALDVVDDFADSFESSGITSAQTFSNAIITELKKLPANFTTQLNAVLTAVKTWSTNMAKEAQTMATNFNTNANKAASDLTTQLNNKLNASLNVAGNWVTKMGVKGQEGARLFLSYMLAAVDEQGKEIEKFGKDIAEHLTMGIENHADWIKNRLKPAYYKIIDEMEEEMGITSRKGSSAAAKAASVAYASDYGLGYGTAADTVSQRAAAAAAVPQTAASTINFYSPKAIDEVEASRLLRKTQQDMLLGF